MTRHMNRTIAIVVTLAMTMGTMYADKLPQPDKKQRRQDIQRLIELRDNPPHSSLLEVLQNADKCFEYCMDAYYRPESEYTQDTAALKELYRQNDWTLDMCQSLTEKEVKKYQLDWFPALMVRAEQENFNTYPRFEEVTQFCDALYERRRKAAAQTMPAGKIKHLVYEEYGSSRPTPVYFEIKVDAATGKAMLYGPENRRVEESEKHPQVALEAEDLNTIRQMIEEHKIYQALPNYFRPIIEDVPPVTGGPPSWYFTCEFEGGMVSTEGDQMRPPRGCTEIASYLIGNYLKSLPQYQ